MGDKVTMSKEKKCLRDHIKALNASSWPFSANTISTMNIVKKHMKQCPAILKGARDFSPEEFAIIEATRKAMLDWISKGKS